MTDEQPQVCHRCLELERKIAAMKKQHAESLRRLERDHQEDVRDACAEAYWESNPDTQGGHY